MALTLAENVSLRGGDLNVSVIDAIALSDIVTAAVQEAAPVNVSASDILSIAEAITVRIPDLGASVSDAITLAELTTAIVGAITISVSDALTIAETVSASMVAADSSLSVSVSDAVSFAENISAVASTLGVSVSDALTLADTATIRSETVYVRHYSGVYPDPFQKLIDAVVATFKRISTQTNNIVNVTDENDNVLVGVQATGQLVKNKGEVSPPTEIDNTDSPYTDLATNENVNGDTDGGAITYNLLAGVNGARRRISNVGSSGNSIALNPNGAEQIRGGGAGVGVTIYDGETLDLVYSSTQGGWW